jgi:tetratricopeptide (TPR) repeat protein
VNCTTLHLIIGSLVLNGLTACAQPEDQALAQSPSSQPPDARPVLRPGFDRFTRSVTTQSPEAQQWFDQGLQLLYGFDHAAAVSAFTQATKLDPGCAMAWWGLAYAHGPNIDNPRMTEAQSKAAYDAAQEGLKHVDHVEPAERALMMACSKRFAWPAPQDRTSLDEAFAADMREAWMQFPNDPEISVAYADSLMIQQPHEYWSHKGEPMGHTRQIITILESTLVDWPSHPGANHFLVLAMEGSESPMNAWRSSSLLQELAPGSGHLGHVSSHIFFRMGHYPRAANGNERAIEADRTAYADPQKASGEYRVQMMRHCTALADAAMMEARLETSMGACLRIEEIAGAELSQQQWILIDGLLATKFQVLVRFGKWDEILREPQPAPARFVSRALRHFARGMAYAATSDVPNAKSEVASMVQLMKEIDEQWLIGMHRAQSVLEIAERVLEGRILHCEGKMSAAVSVLQQAANLEDEVVFKSPRGWMMPVRHLLGALHLKAHQFAEAEAVYRADLKVHPHNGWTMLGLRDALMGQGRDAEAEEFAANVPKAWSRADVTPPSSCYLLAVLEGSNSQD